MDGGVSGDDERKRERDYQGGAPHTAPRLDSFTMEVMIIDECDVWVKGEVVGDRYIKKCRHSVPFL